MTDQAAFKTGTPNKSKLGYFVKSDSDPLEKHNNYNKLDN